MGRRGRSGYRRRRRRGWTHKLGTEGRGVGVKVFNPIVSFSLGGRCSQGKTDLGAARRCKWIFRGTGLLNWRWLSCPSYIDKRNLCYCIHSWQRRHYNSSSIDEGDEDRNRTHTLDQNAILTAQSGIPEFVAAAAAKVAPANTAKEVRMTDFFILTARLNV